MTLDIMAQQAQAQSFEALHTRGDPFLLFNVWDVPSARLVERSGGQALATSSWAVAASLGLDDGEAMPFADLLKLVRALRRTTGLPLTVDIERGYADHVRGVRDNTHALIEAGVIGVNLEDGLASGGLRDPLEQAERIHAMREVAGECGVNLFINARTDAFFVCGETGQAADLAVSRCAAYAAAGASGAFLPGLADPHLVERLCREIALPVNLMVGLNPDREAFGRLGVARLSLGPAGYLAAQTAMAQVVTSELLR